MDKTARGRRGEDAACRYIGRRGYRILERNFRIRGGEIDIIAQSGNCLVFFEVKARTSDRFGEPAEAVGRQKRARILSVASVYLAHSGWQGEARFDIIEAYLFPIVKIRHIKNAFCGNDQ